MATGFQLSPFIKNIEIGQLHKGKYDKFRLPGPENLGMLPDYRGDNDVNIILIGAAGQDSMVHGGGRDFLSDIEIKCRLTGQVGDRDRDLNKNLYMIAFTNDGEGSDNRTRFSRSQKRW